MKSVAAILILYASTAWGSNHMVTVGAGGIVFNPSTITAPVGDTVEFVFTGVLSTVPFERANRVRIIPSFPLASHRPANQTEVSSQH